jgi:peptide-methionine (S)-S-oxide reductase
MPLKRPSRSAAVSARWLPERWLHGLRGPTGGGRAHAGGGRAAAGRRPSRWPALLGGVLALVLLLWPWAPASAAIEEAVLAGGCFWCLEHDLEGLPGVLEVESGYSGGKKANPTYQQVSAGGTGHQESVRVRFDTTKLRYEVLLRAYWRNIDPFDGGGQFCDRGDSYRPVIFTTNATQAVEARNSLVAASRELGRPTAKIKVAVRALSRFWPAENYHQNYARRNGIRYRYYRWACRRDLRLDQVWGERARRSDRWANAAQGASPGGSPTASQAPLPLTSPSAPASPPAPSSAAASAPSSSLPASPPAAAPLAGTSGLAPALARGGSNEKQPVPSPGPPGPGAPGPGAVSSALGARSGGA